MNAHKRIHFYLPKRKVDVDNQIFISEKQSILKDTNFSDHQYISIMNSLLFNLQPPVIEKERLILSQFNNNVAFYLSTLFDSRFEPITPSLDSFSSTNIDLIIDIQETSIILRNGLFDPESKTSIRNRSTIPLPIVLPYKNLKPNEPISPQVYAVIDSLITKNIHSISHRLLESLKIRNWQSGSIICEINDYRFNSKNTYFGRASSKEAIQRRLRLDSNNSVIFYFLNRTREILRMKNELNAQRHNSAMNNHTSLFKSASSQLNHSSILPYNSNQSYASETLFISQNKGEKDMKVEASHSLQSNQDHQKSTAKNNEKKHHVSDIEKKLILLLHPIVITDPSPNVSRAQSLYDFRQKMWNYKETKQLTNTGISQITLHEHTEKIDSKHCSDPQNGLIRLHKPSEQIVIPSKLINWFSSDANTIHFIDDS